MSQENQELRKAGLKVTHPRVKILQVLERASCDGEEACVQTAHHMSAEDVYGALRDAGEEVGLATVYRVLTQFENAGLVIRHHFEGGQSVFELAQGEHHDHMVCLDCGKVFEFTDEVIEERQRLAASNLGFELADHSLYLYGNCSREACENKTEKS